MARPAWRVLGASVAGSSHRRSGRGCEDTHAYRPLPNGSLLLAAADGAGSAARSAEGAAVAVRAALDGAEAALVASGQPDHDLAWRALLEAALRAARAALESLTEASGVGPPGSLAAASIPSGLGDFATTLLLAVVTEHWLAAVQVGDGAIVLWAADDELTMLTEPRPGDAEYLNETTFVTSPEYLEQAQFAVQQRDAPRGLALLTDGLQLLALNLASGRAHAP